ncbi:dipeptidylpeptidase [Cichlidogyrus casuarinus]|uniref:Dipeptidylpeptidase n=1 Tax=Cichlidogyrus casuarinus TaxID=1844966 RepID=A0ABD2Q4C7_9PLAT
MYVDFPNTAENDINDLNWKPLFDEKLLSAKDDDTSLAADLLRERMRSSQTGVTQFVLDEPSGRILFIANGSVYLTTDIVDNENIPKLIQTGCAGILHLSFSPSNSDLAAIISGPNIFIGSLDSDSKWLNLTNYSKSIEGVFAGTPAFAIQEEFNRYIGYWWRPRSEPISETQNLYSILFEHTNETGVDEIYLFSHGSGSLKDFENHRYPKPGAKNANSELKVVQFVYDSSSKEFSNVQILAPNLNEQVKALFATYEYVTRAGWTADGNHVWVQLMNRLQTSAAVYLIPLQLFSNDSAATQLSVVKIFEETSSDEAWVEAHDMWNFLRCSSSTAVEFFTASQVITNAEGQQDSKMGYTDLFHVFRDWSSIKADNGFVDASNSGFIRALTSSQFDITVRRKPLKVFESSGSKDSNAILFYCTKLDS